MKHNEMDGGGHLALMKDVKDPAKLLFLLICTGHTSHLSALN